MNIKLSFIARALLLSTLTLVTSPAWAVPAGFTAIKSAPGVTLYKDGGDYVQVIRLDQGAEIKLLKGPVSDSGIGKGAYGGNNPSIKTQSIKDAWNDFKAHNNRAFCITNGQFFLDDNSPTTLSFPVRINGESIDGYERREFADERLVLELFEGRAEIRKFSDDISTLARNAIVGLSKNASKRPIFFIPRTFVGIQDIDKDGHSETVLIYTANAARQSAAADVLISFGADKVLMLDGSSSTKLICQGEGYLDSWRPVPQTIGVLAAKKPQSGCTISGPFFSDLTYHSNYYNAVCDLYSQDIIKGYEGGKIKTSETINRVEAAKIIALIHADKNDKSKPVDDNDANSVWYTNYKKYVIDHNIMKGYENNPNNFGEGDPITYQEMIKILFTGIFGSEDSGNYWNDGDISNNAVKTDTYICWANKLNLLSSVGSYSINDRTNHPIKRGEVFVALYNALQTTPSEFNAAKAAAKNDCEVVK